MPRYRATVWTLSATAEVVDGDSAIQRNIVEREAESATDFEMTIRDEHIHNVDNNVWFGPISEKK